MTHAQQAQETEHDIQGEEIRPEETPASAGGNAPMFKSRRGRVQVAVWRRKDKDGEDRFSVTVKRSYKTGEGFRDTSSLDPQDLMDAIALLALAQFIVPRQAYRKAAAPQEA